MNTEQRYSQSRRPHAFFGHSDDFNSDTITMWNIQKVIPTHGCKINQSLLAGTHLILQGGKLPAGGFLGMAGN